MDEKYRELYERLLLQQEEIDRLQKETARLQMQDEQAPESEKFDIAKQILSLLEQLREAILKRKPNDLLVFVLFEMSNLTERTLNAIVEVNANTFKERKEIILLRELINHSIKIMISDEFKNSSIDLWDLFFSATEIGKRLPIISSFTDKELGITSLSKQSSFKDIEKILHSRTSGKMLRESRYKNHNKPYEQALRMADDLWASGDTKKHHEMVHYLIEEIEEFKSIKGGKLYESAKRRLLKDIGGLARRKHPNRFYNPGNR